MENHMKILVTDDDPQVLLLTSSVSDTGRIRSSGSPNGEGMA